MYLTSVRSAIYLYSKLLKMTLNELKTVSEFLTEALNFKENDLVKNIAQAIGKATPWAKDIANNAPWVQDFAEYAGAGVPLVSFFLKYAQLLMLEREPDKQGYNACTLAYNRAVEEVLTAGPGNLVGRDHRLFLHPARIRALPPSKKEGWLANVDAAFRRREYREEQRRHSLRSERSVMRAWLATA